MRPARLGPPDAGVDSLRFLPLLPAAEEGVAAFLTCGVCIAASGIRCRGGGACCSVRAEASGCLARVAGCVGSSDSGDEAAAVAAGGVAAAAGLPGEGLAVACSSGGPAGAPGAATTSSAGWRGACFPPAAAGTAAVRLQGVAKPLLAPVCAAPRPPAGLWALSMSAVIDCSAVADGAAVPDGPPDGAPDASPEI